MQELRLFTGVWAGWMTFGAMQTRLWGLRRVDGRSRGGQNFSAHFSSGEPIKWRGVSAGPVGALWGSMCSGGRLWAGIIHGSGVTFFSVRGFRVWRGGDAKWRGGAGVLVVAPARWAQWGRPWGSRLPTSCAWCPVWPPQSSLIPHRPSKQN